jgi:hypothetical protein
MAKSASHSLSQRGRPKGPARVGVFVRLLPEQMRDLRVLREILEGQPPLNGLLEEAVRQYISRKLEDRQIRAEFERRIERSLKVISPRRSREADTV